MGRKGPTRVTAADIAKVPGGVPAFIKYNVKRIVDGDSEAKESACGQLCSLAQQGNGEHSEALYNARAIPALVKILEDGSASAQGSAAGALHWIGLGKEEHQQAIVTCGGIVPLVRLLRTGSAKVQEEVRARRTRAQRTPHLCTRAHARASTLCSRVRAACATIACAGRGSARVD